jgi:hypothetical protein
MTPAFSDHEKEDNKMNVGLGAGLPNSLCGNSLCSMGVWDYYYGELCKSGFDVLPDREQGFSRKLES